MGKSRLSEQFSNERLHAIVVGESIHSSCLFADYPGGVTGHVAGDHGALNRTDG
jgi:hypothetical protein